MPSRRKLLYRDTWGVPHVFADTWADAAYAIGYAQVGSTRDIYKNVRTATGTMAEVFGEDFAEMDYFLRVFKNAEICERVLEDRPKMYA